MEHSVTGQSVSVPVGNFTFSSPTVANTSTVGTEANCKEGRQILPLEPEFEDSRSNTNSEMELENLFRQKGKKPGDLKAYVDAEIASTRLLLEQQQQTLVGSVERLVSNNTHSDAATSHAGPSFSRSEKRRYHVLFRH